VCFVAKWLTCGLHPFVYIRQHPSVRTRACDGGPSPVRLILQFAHPNFLPVLIAIHYHTFLLLPCCVDHSSGNALIARYSFRSLFPLCFLCTPRCRHARLLHALPLCPPVACVTFMFPAHIQVQACLPSCGPPSHDSTPGWAPQRTRGGGIGL
jgi:hypothetical protein